MIDALEAAPIAFALGADDGAAVPAGVEQAVELARLVAAEDHRPAGDPARAEIARLFQLGGMADIDPAAAEDLRHLLAQDVLRDQDLAIEQEGLFLAVIDDVGAHGHFRLPLASAAHDLKWFPPRRGRRALPAHGIDALVGGEPDVGSPECATYMLVGNAVKFYRGPLNA